MRANGPIRLGVVGLGRRFAHGLLPVLGLLRHHLTLNSIHDPNLRKTVRWSGLTRARSMFGVSELIESPEVDAVCLADACWYGVWPALRCAQLGKPVVCLDEQILLNGPSLTERLPQGVWPILTPLTAGYHRLHRLLKEELGAVQSVSVLCQGQQPMRSLLEGLYVCVGLAGGMPEAWRVLAARSGQLVAIVLDWPSQLAAQVNLRQTSSTSRIVRVWVLAERGRVTLSLPGRLSWRSAEGWQRQILPIEWDRTAVLLTHLLEPTDDNPTLGSGGRMELDQLVGLARSICASLETLRLPIAG